MKRVVSKMFQFVSFRVIGRSNTKKVLVQLFDLFNLNPLEVAHSEIGINNYGNGQKTGEEFFLENILKTTFDKAYYGEIVVFDVGANIGEYSLAFRRIFPLSHIYAFEPNPITYKYLIKKGTAINNFNTFCLGLGSGKSQTKIYTYKNHLESEHASLIKDVMVELHNSNEIEEYKIDIIDLDTFCEKANIKQIHFLKIDTEGYEFEVLKGALKLINNRAINVIQFEFNEMNIFSKTFLRDFYSLLPNYTFFRLNSKKLIPLGEYNAANEIFRFQNIVASIVGF